MNSLSTYRNKCSSLFSKWKVNTFWLPAAALLVALLQAAWTAPSYAASRVFHDDFEDGTINKWQEDSGHEGVLVLSSAFDGGAARSGGRFASTNWDGNAYTGLMLPNVSYNKEFLIRMWWRLDRDVDNVDGAKLLRLGFTGQTSNVNELTIQRDGSFHETWYVGNYNNLVKNCWSNHNINDRKWHKIEIYVKDDNANGVFRIWIDGKDTSGCYPYTGDTSSGAKWFPLYMPSNWSMNVGWEHDSTNHFYIDDVEIFSDQGTGATGSMADASISVTGAGTKAPPNPPQVAQ